jgi:hypothetical protein
MHRYLILDLSGPGKPPRCRCYPTVPLKEGVTDTPGRRRMPVANRRLSIRKNREILRSQARTEPQLTAGHHRPEHLAQHGRRPASPCSGGRTVAAGPTLHPRTPEGGRKTSRPVNKVPKRRSAMFEQLGEAIRRHREALGLYQQAVSMDAEIDRSYLS